MPQQQPYSDQSQQPGGQNGQPLVGNQAGNAQRPLAGPEVPQHLVGCQPVELSKRVVLTLCNWVVIGIVIGIVEFVASSIRGAQVAYAWTSVPVWLVYIIAYALTGYTYPFGPVFKVRQVQWRQAKVPGWNGVAKYVLENILQKLLVIPYLVVVFATRNSIQRHWLDRKCGVIVLDIGSGRDPLAAQ